MEPRAMVPGSWVHGALALALKEKNKLPANLPPRGLSRTEAAAYIGVSAGLFDQMVSDRRMPRPKKINSRTVWDIRRLDKAFNELPGDEDDTYDEWESA